MSLRSASSAATFLAAAGRCCRVERRELHLDRLAGRRPGARCRHLDQHARNVGGLFAQLVHDGVRGRARLPVGELELDDADRVFADLAHPARLLAHARVDRGEALELEHAFFHRADQAVLLVEREIAARVHDRLPEVRLDAGEEFHAASELPIGDLHDDEQHRGERERGPGTAQREAHDAHIEAAIGDALVMRDRRRLAEQGAERRREHERNDERGRQGRDQGDRQILHELADDAGPEQQRRECRDPGRGRGDHRARHAGCGERIGLARRHALGHAALGEFRHDDGVVDQHADREDQREQHHDVDGQPGKLQPEHAGEERRRDRDADEQRGAEAEREQDDHDDEEYAGRHRILQVGEHLADDLGLVLAEAHLDAFRPGVLEPLDDRLHGIDGLDQVCAGALTRPRWSSPGDR